MTPIATEQTESITEASLTAAGPRADVELSVAATTEHGLLQQQPGYGDTKPSVIPASLSISSAWRFYVSHFSSSWDSRVIEFVTALSSASTVPGTLLPVSIYSLSLHAQINGGLQQEFLGRWRVSWGHGAG